MAADLKKQLLEQIALEGLDGITINTLWLRLGECKEFTMTCDEDEKPYLWRCIQGLSDVSFYQMEEPRPDLIPYNRFHYVDPETRHFLETEHIPDDIYPLNIINEDGVMGSCAGYNMRTDVTERVRGLSLSDNIQEFGNRLVIVGSQALRSRALLGDGVNPSVMLTEVMYCILERIGRSRDCGELCVGKQSMQVFNLQAKTLFYHLKKLRYLNVVRKQRLCTIKKPSNQKVSCLLYHLTRFYFEVGSKIQHELLSLARYLSEKPGHIDVVSNTKQKCKIYDKEFKKISQVTNTAGDRYFEFIDIPYREKFPNATPKEYMLKSGRAERTIRHIRLKQSLTDMPNNAEGEDSDEDEDEEELGEETVSDQTFPKVLDQPYMYQVLNVLRKAGARGLSQVELKRVLKVNRLCVRRTMNFLHKLKYVSTVLKDKGRQKIIMYVAAELVTENQVHKNMSAEIKKFGDIEIKEKHQYTVKEEKKEEKRDSLVAAKQEKRNSLVAAISDVPPTQEKMEEIQEELNRIDEQNKSSVPHPPSKERVAIMKELIADGTLMQVRVEEDDMMGILTPGKEGTTGMKKFGSMITENHIRRANWIVEVVSAVKVVENFRLIKLLRNRERDMDLQYIMDQKSMKRLVIALVQEKRIRFFRVHFLMKDKKKEINYLCDSSVEAESDVLLRNVDQAKLRHFSVSKEQLRIKMKMTKEAAATSTKKPPKDDIPESAKESIRKHQEYRQKLAEALPPMQYDRKASYNYGALPKMLRIQVVHQYLFHLCHDMYGEKIRCSDDGGAYDNWRAQGTQTERIDVQVLPDGSWPNSFADSNEPVVYCDEMTWKRYIPPVPVHSGYPKGWCLISDILLNLPVITFCQIVAVCYNIEGLSDILAHPKLRLFPVINLPFSISQQLLHSKKYMANFLEVCNYLSEMGLLSFGKEVFKDKDQTFVYLHQNASLLDTRESDHGYNKTHLPEGMDQFPEKTFHFDSLPDVCTFWENLQIIALSSNLSMKSFTISDLEDEKTFEVRSLRESGGAHTPDTIRDDGVIPGDRRGGAGLDSSLFVHTPKNWTCKGMFGPKKKYKKMEMSSVSLVGGKKIIVEDTIHRLKGKDRLYLSDNPAKPSVEIKKVKRETIRYGSKVARAVRLRKTHKVLRPETGRVRLRRVLQIKPKKDRKKPAEKGDDKDRSIYAVRMKQRVSWSSREDSVLLMCRLAALIMDNNRKISLVNYCAIRDYLHENCGEVAHDKTSLAASRRLKFVLKNPQTESNLLMFYREAMQDEYIVQNYVSSEYLVTDKSVIPKFRKLADYLLDKFSSLDVLKCSLPETLNQLEGFVAEPVGRLTRMKEFNDVTSKVDVCHDVLRNILHSAVLLRDRMGRTHEMFKLLTQYPEVLLGQVIQELRKDGLLVIQKKQYQKEALTQLQTGLGLRNFKVSQRYMYNYKHRYLSTLFEDSAEFLDKLCQSYLEGDGDDQRVTLNFHPKGGQSAILIPLLLKKKLDFKVTLPDELVVVDMEGFYNFPWGRGKTMSSASKADKSLQNLYSRSGKTTGSLGKFNFSNRGITTSNRAKVMVEPEEDMEEDDEFEEGLNTIDESSKASDDSTRAAVNLFDSGSKENDKDTANDSLTKEQSSVSETRTTDGEPAVSSKKSLFDISTHSVDSDAVPSTSSGPELPSTSGSTNVKLIDEFDTVPKAALKGSNTGFAHAIMTANRKVARAKAVLKKQNLEQYAIGDDIDAVENRNLQVYHKGSSEMRIPLLESRPDIAFDVQNSSIASRTLLSLRRAEDTSFEDIRVFNAQDNFVVNSCVIKVKIRDDDIETNGAKRKSDSAMASSNAMDTECTDEVVIVMGQSGEIENISEAQGPHSSEMTMGRSETMGQEHVQAARDSVAGTSREEASGTRSVDKNKVVQELLMDKNRMKRIWENLMKLVPFSVDMGAVWTRMKQEGGSDTDLANCKQVYDIVDHSGELGIRQYNLQKQVACPWKPAIDALVRHNARHYIGMIEFWDHLPEVPGNIYSLTQGSLVDLVPGYGVKLSPTQIDHCVRTSKTSSALARQLCTALFTEEDPELEEKSKIRLVLVHLLHLCLHPSLMMSFWQ